MSTQFDFRGKSVLELGAGAGAPGLTAALLGATKVLLTDIEPLVPGLLKNVEVNGLADQVQVRELMWRSDQSNQLSELNEFDVVLMSDVFYDPEEMVGLGKTLRRMCTKETMILAASEVRLSTDECLNDLASQGFRAVELHNQLSSSVGNRNLEVYAIYQLTAPDKDVDHVSHNPPM